MPFSRSSVTKLRPNEISVKSVFPPSKAAHMSKGRRSLLSHALTENSIRSNLITGCPVALPAFCWSTSEIAHVRRICPEGENMGNTASLKFQPDPSNGEPSAKGAAHTSATAIAFDSIHTLAAGARSKTSRRLVSTKELAEIWGLPESTLRYWRCAETGPPYVKVGGRIRYDLADVENYVRANKRMPSVRAHGG